MKERTLTYEQKKIEIDLYIILASSLIVIGLYSILQNRIMLFIDNLTIPILLRTLVSALIQFGVAGLGITMVSILRKESFFNQGLKMKGTALSILLCSFCFLPHLAFLLATKQIDFYLPFQSVWVANEVLESNFPVNIIGLVLITISWGFFEGFNYVFISDKINKRYPTKNRWLNIGAIASAIFCILIHGTIGLTPKNFIEMITIIILIYGMLMVKEFTKNAWGCVFLFVFFWNAF